MKVGAQDRLNLGCRYRSGFFAKSLPVYKRAWEIVNDIEGQDAFIKELKAMLRNGAAPN